jgi:hypothetical protein
VVWSDLRGGNADLYFRRSEDQSGIFADGQVAGVDRRVVLTAPYPNPFAGATKIGFLVPYEARAAVQVFDVEGRLVARLAGGTFQAGPHVVTWDGRTHDGRRAPAGIYFIRLKCPLGEDTRRVVLAR